MSIKKWISLGDQVDKHLSRGLMLGESSKEDFSLFLYTHNYYRFSGYARCFYETGTERYKPGTTLQQIQSVYETDRLIKNLIMDGVSVLEVALKSRFAYNFSETLTEPGEYLRPSCYLPTEGEDSNTGSRRKAQLHNRNCLMDDFAEMQKRKEIFISHYVDNNEPVPFWAAVEVLSLGKFCRLLKGVADRGPVIKVKDSLYFDREKNFLQAVQNVSFLRNIAAHNGRIWNRKFQPMAFPPKRYSPLSQNRFIPRSPIAGLVLISGMVDIVEKGTDFSTEMMRLVNKSEDSKIGYYEPIL